MSTTAKTPRKQIGPELLDFYAQPGPMTSAGGTPPCSPSSRTMSPTWSASCRASRSMSTSRPISTGSGFPTSAEQNLMFGRSSRCLTACWCWTAGR